MALRVPYLPKGLSGDDLIRALNERLGRLDNPTRQGGTGMAGVVERLPSPPSSGATAPQAPTDVLLTVTEVGNAFYLDTTWTPAAVLGGTVKYALWAQFAEDDEGTGAGDWIGLGVEIGSSTSEAHHGPFPLTVAQYVRTKVIALNYEEDAAADALSGYEAVNAASGGGEGRPNQPDSADDWTVTVIASGVPDEYGRQYAQVRIEIVNWPVGADFFSVWTYEGTSPPTDPALWLQGDWGSQEKFSAGNTTKDIWPSQPAAGTTYQICIVFQTYTYFAFPDASTITKSFVLAATTAPDAVTDFNVTAEFTTDPGETEGAVALGRFICSGTAPTDPLRHEFVIERRQFSQAGWDEDDLIFDWTPVFYTRELPYEQPKWSWAVGPIDGYYEWRIKSRGWDAQETVGSPVVRMTITAAGTVNLAYVASDSLGRGVVVSGGKLTVTADALDNSALNPNWQYGSNDYAISTATYFWMSSGGGENGSNAGEIKPGGYVAVSASPIFIGVPGEVWYVAVRYKAIGSITLGSGSGGHTNHLCCEWINEGGTVISHSDTAIGSSTSWSTVSATVTAPTGAVYLKVYVYRGHLTAGYMRIGRVVAVRQRGLTDIVNRAITDAKIALAGIADHQVLADSVIARSGLFVNSVVTNRAIANDVNADRVTAGKFSGRALGLTLSGVQVDIDVVFDPSAGDYAGIRLLYPSNSGRLLLGPGACYGFDVYGNLSYILSVGGGRLYLRSPASGATFDALASSRLLSLSGGEWAIYNNGQQILRGRQAAIGSTVAVPSTPSWDGTIGFDLYNHLFNVTAALAAAVNTINDLRVRLGPLGHGLIAG